MERLLGGVDLEKDDFTALPAANPAVERKVLAVVAQRMRYR